MEKIIKLRNYLKIFNLDGYIIPKNDEFFNEYTSSNKDRLNYISNFSGSFGLALILKKKNYLFVDGRYTLQAKIQSGANFKVITIPSKYPSDLFKGKKYLIGYDPKLHTNKMLDIFFKKTSFKLVPIKDNLVDKIWVKANTISLKKYYVLPKKEVGQSNKSKIKRLSKILKKKGVDYHFVTSSENIAWLLNIRGWDSKYSPVPNAYLIIGSNKDIHLFCNLKKIDVQFKRALKGVRISKIEDADFFLKDFKHKKISLDSATCSVYFENIIKLNNKLISYSDPIYLMKSVKTKTEIKNTIKCHIYDGVALTKFLFWVKKNFKNKKINEISAEEKLLKFRKKNKNFKFPSFPTISGAGPNGAIIHYKASQKSNRRLEKGDIYLVDSGGQYNYGTTDVTRTISLDNNSQRIKNIFTKVLQGHIAVASFKLKKNTTGAEVDAVARKPLLEMNLDYAHGTGHGVGYFLNVHEGPHAISKKNKIYFEEGVIVSNEPGYYETNKFGIRIENLVRVKKTRAGYFFDNLTMAPIDKSLINKKMLRQNEIQWLNEYHSVVYKNLKKFMNKSELNYLKESCSNI
tara:strand:+ start:12652 stop:14370 length:1719 start_codon:yes stop_codon:yes gene_type:complete